MAFGQQSGNADSVAMEFMALVQGLVDEARKNAWSLCQEQASSSPVSYTHLTLPTN